MGHERVEAESPKLPAAPSPAAAPALAHASVLALQQSAGNAAVARLLARAPTKDVALTGAKLNHQRVSVPVEAGLAVTASAVPAKATGVTFGVEKLTVDPSDTAVDSSTGAVTIGDSQPGGDLKVTAETSSVKAGAALRTIEKPTSLDSTSQTAKDAAGGSYGGEFTHTFKGKGKPAGLADGRVNEKFDDLTPKNPFGKFTLKANKANSAGWPLDSSGKMMAVDNVTIQKSLIDVRPFIKSASNPAPAQTLPAGFSMTQHLHVKSKPSDTLDAAPFADTEHVRRLEERKGALVVVVGAGNGEVVQDYTGPPAYRNAKASVTSIVASPPKPPAPKGGTAPAWARSEFTVTGDALPSSAKKVFSIVQKGKDRLGCEIDSATGIVKVGSQAGSITVRVSDGTNAHFDEVSVTITVPPAAPAAPGAGSAKGAALDTAAPEDEGAGELALADTGVGLAGLGEGRMLARQHAPAQAPPQDVFALAKAKAWDAAVAALVPYADDVAVQTLARLTHDELMALDAAAARGPTATRARRLVAEGERRRVELLRKAWTDALDKDWEAAAEVLNAFIDSDIADMVKTLKPDQLKALEAGAVKRLPGYHQRILEQIRKRLGAKPGEVYGKVVRTRYFAKPRIPGVTPVWQAYCELRFEPDPAVARASKIGFIQTVRMVDLPSDKPNDPIPGHAGRATPSGSTLDRPGGSKSAIYAQKNDGSLDGTNKFGSSPAPYSPAEFVDKPDWDRGPMRWDYELAVVALEGPDAGIPYARIEWGFTVEDQSGTLMPVMRDMRIEDKPSPDFHAAVAGWNRQAAGPAGGRTDPGQQQAPVLR